MALAGSVSNPAELKSAFGKPGFSQTQADQSVSTLTDHVSKAAGPDVGMSLANVVK